MGSAALIFSLLNKVLSLNFPTWILAIAAALLVFIFLYAYINSIKYSGNPTIYYTTTAIINSIIVVLMLTITGISQLVFRYPHTAAFSFGRPQSIATIIYCVLIGICIAIPLLRHGSEYISEAKAAKKLKKLQQAIDTNDVAGFEKEYEKNNNPGNIRLNNGFISVFNYLVDEDKKELVQIAIKKEKDFLADSDKWNIKSTDMLQLLVQNGLDINQAIFILVRHQQDSLVKWAVNKYQPTFAENADLIIKDLMQQRNMEMFDFLIANDFIKDKDACAVVLRDFVNNDDIESVKLLLEKGYPVETAYRGMVYSAVYSKSAEMMKLLLQYPFDVNKLYDEYTFLEYAAKSGYDDKVALLLTKNPDVQTLHTTKFDGAVNALILAEKYNHPGIVEQLKNYITRRMN